ncbi:MAG: DNRLRE domain-containing protein [bacterium]|nr:DNRLRE domain-containing protein [bacterium]
MNNKEINFKFPHLWMIICMLPFIWLFVLAKNGSSQSTDTYFEQQGNTFAIEAEKAIGYGGLEINSNVASAGSALWIPTTDTIIISVSEDTYVDLYARDISYGSATELWVDGKGGMTRAFFDAPWWDSSYDAFEKAAFLKFYVSDLTDIIIEAKVFLYCTSSGIGGGIYALDPLMDDLNWSEATATWNNRPSKHYDGNTFQDYLGPVTAGNWYSFDVTEALHGKTNGNYSFGIVIQNDQPTAWSSKEGSHPPYLLIRFKKTNFSISGLTKYYSNSNPIANVLLSLTGGMEDNQTSGAEGAYFFSNLLADQNYTVNAFKPADTDIGAYDITTFDAALTAQAAVGIRELSMYQQIAADVNRDQSITTFDAALIAQYSVGMPKTSQSHVGEWYFDPENRIIENLDSEREEQNFIGILLGNVHGGWSQPVSLTKNNFLMQKYTSLPEIYAEPGQEFSIPFMASGCDDILSIDIDFRYDSDLMSFQKIVRTGLKETAELFYHRQPGRLRIGIYDVALLDQDKELIQLKFEAADIPGKDGWMYVDRYQLNDQVVKQGQSLVIISGERVVPVSFKLHQSYPNPFMPGVGHGSKHNGIRILYQIPEQGRVELNVYNYLGQHIRTLAEGERPSGNYTVYWDGRDNNASLVSSGIYLYRLEWKDRVEIKRLIFFR